MLTSDVMFVGGTTFLIILSRKINFVTDKNIPSWMEYHLSKRLNKLMKLYGRVVFVLRAILVDVEFQKITYKLGYLEVNIAVTQEHVV